MNRAEWFEQIQRLHMLELAEDIGLEVHRPRGSSGGEIYGCPNCHALRRHTKVRSEKRGAIGIRNDGSGWRCFQCDASGNGLDLIAYARHGRRYRELTDHEKGEVKEWCLRFLGIDASPALSRPYRPQRLRPTTATPKEPEPEPSYPPELEVHALWKDCVAVTSDEEVSIWLESRDHDPQTIADRDLARVLPRNAMKLPSWARSSFGTWQKSGHRFIVPLYDSRGALRSVLARYPGSHERKSTSANRYARRGLIMMDSLARQVFENGAKPSWWSSAEQLCFLIAEGEMDFLRGATDFSDSNEHVPAAIGIFSGGWLQSHADRIPDGSEIAIATDNDEQGDKYAKEVILESFKMRYRANRVKVTRCLKQKAKD